MTRALTLALLLERLRLRGVEIGVREMRWLDTIFNQQPPGESSTLRHILVSVLAKDESSRLLVDREVVSWMGDAGDALAQGFFEEKAPVASVAPAAPIRQIPPLLDTPLPRFRRPISPWRSRAPAILAGAALLVLALPYLIPAPPVAVPSPPIAAEAPPVEPALTTPVPNDLRVEPNRPLELPIWYHVWPWVEDWLPTIRIVPRTPSAMTLGFLSGTLSAALLSAFLLLRHRAQRVVYRSRRKRGPPPPAILLPCPTVVSHLPSETKRALIWNVEHFVSEEWTERIDVGSTVTKTARGGGVLTLVYEAARYPREVWLWREDHPEAHRVAQVAAEIATDLTRSGLPVRTGSFHRTPREVTWDDSGETFTPAHAEGAREQVVLGILTLGEGIEAADQHATERWELEPLWNSLSQWPRVAVGIDREITTGKVAALDRHHLVWCPLRDLAQRLSGSTAAISTGRRPPKGLDTELRAWAAGLALAGRRFTDSDAHALRRAMKLLVDPWRLEEIKSLTGVRSTSGLSEFHPRLRTELPAWLMQTTAFEAGFPADSWPARALSFWRNRLSEVQKDEDSRSDATADPLGRAGIALDLALLNLWDNPNDAALSLRALAEGGYAEVLRSRLSSYYAADQVPPPSPESTEDDFDGHETHPVVLPWVWEAPFLAESSREILGHLGFAAGGLEPTLRVVWPQLAVATLGLGAGICLSLALWAGWQAFRPVQFEHFGLSGSVSYTQGFGTLAARPTAWVRTRVHERAVPMRGRSDVQVDWSSKRAASAEWFGESVCLRRGIRRDPQRTERPSLPRQVIALLDYSKEDAGAQKLAARLLDGGNVDLVFLGADATDALEGWLAREGPFHFTDGAVVVVTHASNRAEAILSRLRTGRTSEAQWGSMVAERADVLLQEADAKSKTKVGYGITANLESNQSSRAHPSTLRLNIAPAQLIDLAAIPAGHFLMGSPESEVGHESDEGPQHWVTLSGFCIGRTEVTRSQYASVVGWSEVWGPAGINSQLPATGVSWLEAVQFCNVLSVKEGLEPAYDTNDLTLLPERSGYRLPTEAQWEYACRAGTSTRFWSGDSDIDLDRVDWYWANSLVKREGQEEALRSAHPVAEKPANPFGLHDVHGNAMEWCQDWYPGTYNPLHAKETADQPSDSVRVLRGGSFGFVAWGCRSAFRFRWYPGFWDGYVGFRVVLPVPPEPNRR